MSRALRDFRIEKQNTEAKIQALNACANYRRLPEAWRRIALQEARAERNWLDYIEKTLGEISNED